MAESSNQSSELSVKSDAQKERIEALKARLNKQNYELIRKEVLLGLNSDLT